MARSRKPSSNSSRKGGAAAQGAAPNKPKMTKAEILDEREFHSELIDIFVSLRDLHTNYTLPSVYWSKFAYLPFRAEEYYVDRERKYLLSWVSPQNTEPKLKAGLQI